MSWSFHRYPRPVVRETDGVSAMQGLDFVGEAVAAFDGGLTKSVCAGP
jgi:hypothetical protein